MQASNIVKFMLTMVMLTVGMNSPFFSSVAVSLMIFFIPILFALIVHRRFYDKSIIIYIRYQIYLISIFFFYSLVAFVKGGMPYPSYLFSILIHICFFVGCLIMIGPISIVKIFLLVGAINIFFYAIQLFGGFLDSPVLMRLEFLNIMNAIHVEKFGFFPRASGLASEPVHLSYLLLPSLLLLFLMKSRNGHSRRYKKAFFISTYFATFSLVASVQLAISLVLTFFRKLSLANGLKAVLFSFAIFYIYTLSPIAQERISGLEDGFSGVETNQSSIFAIQSNILVAGVSLQDSPILGRGLTSHRKTFEDSFVGLFGNYIDESWTTMNQNDGASLYILIVSEMGILGIFGYFLFLFYLFNKFKKSNNDIAIIGLVFTVCLAMNSLRYGNIASLYIMLNLQIVLYCLALLKFNTIKKPHKI